MLLHCHISGCCDLLQKTQKCYKIMSKVKTNPVRFADPDRNPCIEEHKESLICLTAHNYNRDKCSVPFLNYRDCKTFWNKVSKKRAEQGKEPHMPTAAERRDIIKVLGDKLPYINL